VRRQRDDTVRPTTLPLIRVRTAAGHRTRGWLTAGPFRIPVALGRGGIKADKREGDGATPAGRFRLKRLWWRADRGPRPRTLLPVRRIGPQDAWSEDPADRNYNRSVRRPPGAPGDRLMRHDHLYNLIIELDHNTRPRVAGRGSAVFIHIARPGYGPTAGCVAMKSDSLRLLLGYLGARTEVVVRFQSGRTLFRKRNNLSEDIGIFGINCSIAR
jgi:L,D-peptidoglycan transpeptidase YkuD (ErfK/YbiS/YcfS/YnhG family)